MISKATLLKQNSIKHSGSVDKKWSTGDVKWKIPEISLKHLNIYILFSVEVQGQPKYYRSI